jgi:broad specificity phosphatase PhoE
MKITFLRHGSLLAPFDDYTALTLKQLSQLARQEIDPSIDPLKIGGQLSQKKYLLPTYDALFVSQSQRTQDTASELSKIISLPQMVKLKALNEILFDPSELVTQKEYREEKLTIIRQRLFKALTNSFHLTNLESKAEIVSRLYQLDQILSQVKGGSVLAITHGFLMRYLDIFYRQESHDFSESALKKAPNYNYAAGFTVTAD